MKGYVLRPLYVIIGIVVVVLIIKELYVPKDFGIGETGYMYGWHRKGNEEEWKAFKVKYQTKEYCKDCHEEKYKANMSSKHKAIECENCHGPAIEHPENPEKLTIDKSRALCIRCHSYLPYASSLRSKIKGINPLEHNPEDECSTCHDPHSPNLS
ncbi:MAG: cytochrome C [Candidatus Schekmanbacteria bacterium RBG_16_38_10]|uniref:Cytochrome C n=1 Tax=Candidatus Schekmanbacteria bacterium RBG_16_38_10 TaxID=1817879 RepID=A0A1F7S0B5_9BACT|nr:MAG: cytochrome C [Candidatus Schekmanbacteria bacterium RBG_16_38_10]